MATNQLSQVIQSLRGAAFPAAEAELTDGQLLESYVRSREEVALAALVRRHGPMVWGVCRRVLRSHQDAEDAFQATFLVLVRKAAAIMQREKVANWLYGVAHQTALKARATTARRGAREKQVTAMPEPVLETQDRANDLQPLLDQELSRLPDKYRTVLVLCELEGKTRKEAARHLRVPEGTVASRLATARTMLARRLGRHGPAVSSAALAALLAQSGSAACVPLSVASSTIKAASLYAAGQATAGALSAQAVTLAEGVLRTMLLTKLKIITTVLVALVFLGAGAVAFTQQVPDKKTPAIQPAPEKFALAEKPANQPVLEKKEPAAQPLPEKEKPAAQPLPEKKKAVTKPALVMGVVKAVDTVKKTITVTTKNGESLFTMAKDAQISIDHNPRQLIGIPHGANVTLTMNGDGETVKHVGASGDNVFGSVKAVDTAKSTITGAGGPYNGKAVDTAKGTITVAGGPHDGKTFIVVKNTYITIDGKPGTLAAIPLGAQLHALNLCVDQKTAGGINVCGPSYHNTPVKAVDPANNTLTVDDKAPANVAGKVFTVAKEATISIDGKPGKLTGIPAGSFVNLGMSVDKQTILNLQAEGPTLGGCGGSPIKAVDAANYTITFDDKAPAQLAGKTFTIAKGASIAIDSKPAQLADVPVDSYINLTLTVDQQTVRSVWAQGPGSICDCGGSLVKAVDVAKYTITFDEKAKAEVAGKTFTVARDANIQIDAKLGTLADVPVGCYVNLSLSADRQFANSVFAQGPPMLGSVVNAVDAANHTITIDGTTYPVAKNVNMLIGNKQGQLADMPAGAKISTLRLCVDQKTVGTIFVNVK